MENNMENNMGNFSENESEDSGRKVILAVDDDRIVLQTLRGALGGKYDVRIAASGEVALRFLSSHSCDLILLDYEMPAMSGPQVLEKLKEDPVHRDLPVVFLTGISESEKIKEVLSLKPAGYLLKPIDTQRLMTIVERVI